MDCAFIRGRVATVSTFPLVEYYISDFRFIILHGLLDVNCQNQLKKCGLPQLLGATTVRDPFARKWLFRQPAGNAHQIHTGRDENMLQVRFDPAQGACSSQVQVAHAIGKGPLNASAPGIMFGEGLSFFACSGSLLGFIWSGDAQSRYAGADSRVLPFLT